MPLKSWMTQTLMVDVFDWLRTLVVAVVVEVEEGVAVEGDARDHLAQGHVRGQGHALGAGEAAHGQGLEEAVEAGAAAQSHEVGPSHVDAQSQSLHHVLSPVQGQSQSNLLLINFIPMASTFFSLLHSLSMFMDICDNGYEVRPVDYFLTGQGHRSRGRSKSKSKSRSRSRSRSRSEPKNDRSKSRSQSNSKAKSRSKDRSRSRSVSKGHSKSKSRSRSKSPDKNDKSPDKKDD
uniref:Uncharacterized protein n=2 Tax=Timema TaxID=61471 RepID=A0A7R9GVU5_TIMCR|nr:unnamed protein product [Timema cristinae]